MKLGTENRTQLIVLGVLGAIAVVAIAYGFWPSSAPAAPAVAQIAASKTTSAKVRRTASGKAIKVAELRLDPTLDLDLLRQTEQTKYAGSGRNIFVNGMPVAVANGSTDHPKGPKTVTQIPAPPPQTPPPPINLKFFGYASKPGEPKRIFLSKGDDVFIAAEGDIIDRRYRIVHIAPAAVDIEDVLYNNKQSIPLTQG